MKPNIKKQPQNGFTVVELVVVIVVIGILAAISLVSYSQVRKDAKESSYKATAQEVKLKLGGYYTDNSHYPRQKSDIATYLTAINAGSSVIDEFAKTEYVYAAYTNATGATACATDSACQYYEITVDKSNWGGDSNVVTKP